MSLVSQVLSFRHAKQIFKNVGDTTFKLITCSYTINIVEKKMTIYKNNDWSLHQNSLEITDFYFKQNSRFIFRHLMLKSLKNFITEYIPDARTNIINVTPLL